MPVGTYLYDCYAASQKRHKENRAMITELDLGSHSNAVLCDKINECVRAINLSAKSEVTQPEHRQQAKHTVDCVRSGKTCTVDDCQPWRCSRYARG
jgi:hypothetical protein